MTRIIYPSFNSDYPFLMNEFIVAVLVQLLSHMMSHLTFWMTFFRY